MAFPEGRWGVAATRGGGFADAVGCAEGATGFWTSTVFVVGCGEDFELKTPAAASAIATPPSTRIVAQTAMTGHRRGPAAVAGSRDVSGCATWTVGGAD